MLTKDAILLLENFPNQNKYILHKYIASVGVTKEGRTQLLLCYLTAGHLSSQGTDGVAGGVWGRGRDCINMNFYSMGCKKY